MGPIKGRTTVINKKRNKNEATPEENTKNAGAVTSNKITLELGGNVNLCERRKYRKAKAI